MILQVESNEWEKAKGLCAALYQTGLGGYLVDLYISNAESNWPYKIDAYAVSTLPSW